MCELRTLNIRNMPPIFTTPLYAIMLFGNMHEAVLEGIKEVYANTVLQMLFPQGSQGARRKAALQTLGIGSLTYRDRPRSCSHLQIYSFATWSLLDGQQRLRVTLREAGTYEGTEAAVGDVTVFKSCWLE